VSGPLEIHQLFHGYRRGHEQLAASVKLSRPDSDLVTRLSDLSGTLVSGFAFESYVTMYPLPSAQSYAVALTRPDPSAPRPGCVLTHTLLVGMDDWAILPSPVEISSLFADSTTVPDDPISPLKYIPNAYSLRNKPLISQEDEDFVARYFGEGIRPIVWFDAPTASDRLWGIIAGLWPALRLSFAGCTLCLQPRTLDKRMFDVMFAPRIASSRFSRLSPDHFVGSPEVFREPWHREFAVQLFGHLPANPEITLFGAALDDDPTSIRKLFLFQDLWSRSEDKPAAAVGAFDLLDSIRPSKETSRLQNIALNRALSGFDGLTSVERLELFSMLIRRIPRIRAHSQNNEIWPALQDAVLTVIREFPDAALADVEKVWPTLDKNHLLRSGLMSSLATALPETPALAVAVAGHADIGKDLLAEYPRVFAKAIEGPGAKVLLDQVLEWLNEDSYRDRLYDFRIPFIEQLQLDEDSTLFRKLLTDLRTEDVAPVLEAIFEKNTLRHQSRETREVVIDLIARPFPNVTARWIEDSSRRDDALAEILSASYSINVSEYSNKVTSARFDRQFSQRVLSYWIVRNAAHNSRFVNDVGGWASRDAEVLDLLLEPDGGAIADRALRIVAETVGSIPTNSSPLFNKIFGSRPGYERLIDTAIRSAIRDYVRSATSEAIVDELLGQRLFVDWLGRGKSWRLAGAIRAGISGFDSCSRAWQVIYKFPNAVFERDVVVGTIDSLLVPTAQFFSPLIADTWVNVVRRARFLVGDPMLEAELCGQAVRFAFDNARLPVSKLVVEGFLPLYRSVTEMKKVPVTAAPMFSMWDWDKGGELRETLVDKFSNSNWPPGDLALAIDDLGLLRKIMKRLSRKHGGNSFARKMYSDLVSRTEGRSQSLASALSDLLKNPGYYEEWD
jgi:hypothetical protein